MLRTLQGWNSSTPLKGSIDLEDPPLRVVSHTLGQGRLHADGVDARAQRCPDIGGDGAAFVVIYRACIFLICASIMAGEITIGRSGDDRAWK